MASRKDYVEYVAEQCGGAGAITWRPMFGEYGLYCDGIFFAVVCDDQLFVKITPETRQRFPSLPAAPPYEGAKPYFFVEDVDDRAALAQLIAATCAALSVPKRGKGRACNGKD